MAIVWPNPSINPLPAPSAARRQKQKLQAGLSASLDHVILNEFSRRPAIFHSLRSNAVTKQWKPIDPAWNSLNI